MFEPHPSIRDPYLRFTLPKLAAYLLYAAMLSLIAIPLDIYSVEKGWLPYQPLFDAIVFGYLYVRARSKNPTWVPEFTIFFNLAIIVMSLYMAPALSFLVVPMLLIPLLLCTMFLSYRLTMISYIITVIALMLMIGSYEGKTREHYTLTVAAYTLVGVVVLLQSWYQKSYETFRITELESSELRYRTLLSEAYDGIVTVQAHTIQTIDSTLAEQLDFTSDGLVGTSIDVLLPHLDMSQVDAVGEVTGFGRNAAPYYFEYVMVQDQTHDPQTTIIALRDVTEQRKTEEALAHAQRVDSLGVLAGGIAHDFNNLLTGIKGQATIAQMKLPDDNPVQKTLVKLLASTERASDLTRQLLAYAGKGSFETKTFDFNEFANNLLKLLRSNLPTHIQMAIKLSEQPLPVTADPTQLQQVLLNLVINGAQAIGDDPGEIIIQTKYAQITQHHTLQPIMWDKTQLPAGHYVRCAVTDSGCGMNDATLKRVFDPFFTTKETGTGLGLAATMGALKAHTGNLQVFSTVGEGTEFVIWLPLSTEDVAAIRPNRPTPTETVHDSLQTILVIDDEQTVRDTVSEMLTLAGYQVYSAENGTDGLALYEQHRDSIDLVLLDMQMPNMNGETTYYHLTAINPTVRVILMSGYSELSSISRLTNDRNLSFISKPFEHSLLLETVKQAAYAVPALPTT